jgi:centromeric protein E
VVNGAMEGVNGTVFAYGVTSSGKTHTMHGDQKSPGIIPLAIKDVFSIIQETPDREFLLRVSYLEIYNEVINDLLDPLGQNLRVREDGQQGTYVEGIKEEVVLSPAHALSLIAAGEGTSTLLQTLHLLEVTVDCKFCPLALVTRPLS